MLPKAIKSLRSSLTVCAVITALIPISASAGDTGVFAIGTVDFASCSKKAVSVLGIDFRAVDRAGAAAICALQGDSQLSYIAVTGRLNATGAVEFVNARILSPDGYVPGSTSVYLKGVITEADPLTGRAVINGATVSTTS